MYFVSYVQQQLRPPTSYVGGHRVYGLTTKKKRLHDTLKTFISGIERVVTEGSRVYSVFLSRVYQTTPDSLISTVERKTFLPWSVGNIETFFVSPSPSASPFERLMCHPSLRFWKAGGGALLSWLHVIICRNDSSRETYKTSPNF